MTPCLWCRAPPNPKVPLHSIHPIHRHPPGLLSWLCCLKPHLARQIFWPDLLRFRKKRTFPKQKKKIESSRVHARQSDRRPGHAEGGGEGVSHSGAAERVRKDDNSRLTTTTDSNSQVSLEFTNTHARTLIENTYIKVE